MEFLDLNLGLLPFRSVPTILRDSTYPPSSDQGSRTEDHISVSEEDVSSDGIKEALSMQLSTPRPSSHFASAKQHRTLSFDLNMPLEINDSAAFALHNEASPQSASTQLNSMPSTSNRGFDLALFTSKRTEETRRGAEMREACEDPGSFSRAVPVQDQLPGLDESRRIPTLASPSGLLAPSDPVSSKKRRAVEEVDLMHLQMLLLTSQPQYPGNIAKKARVETPPRMDSSLSDVLFRLTADRISHAGEKVQSGSTPLFIQNPMASQGASGKLMRVVGSSRNEPRGSCGWTAASRRTGGPVSPRDQKVMNIKISSCSPAEEIAALQTRVRATHSGARRRSPPASQVPAMCPRSAWARDMVGNHKKSKGKK